MADRDYQVTNGDPCPSNDDKLSTFDLEVGSELNGAGPANSRAVSAGGSSAAGKASDESASTLTVPQGEQQAVTEADKAHATDLKLGRSVMPPGDSASTFMAALWRLTALLVSMSLLGALTAMVIRESKSPTPAVNGSCQEATAEPSLFNFEYLEVDGPAPGPDDELVNRAITARVNGRSWEALGLLNQALAIRPKSERAFCQRALVYLILGSEYWQRAEDDASNAIESSNNPSVYAYMVRGRARMLLGLFDLALADFTTVLQRRPQCSLALGRRGEIRLVLGQLSEALQDLDQALSKRPEIAEFWRSRAMVHYRLGDCSKALQNIDQALRLQPRFCAAHICRGRILLALGQTADAVEACSYALHLRENCWQALSERSLAYALLSRDREAIADAKRAYYHGQRTPSLFRAVAHVLLRTGRPELAVPYLSKAATHGVEEAADWTALADAARRSGQTTLAETAHARALALQNKREPSNR